VNSARARTVNGFATGSSWQANYNQTPGLGYHYAQMLEYAGAAGTTTFYGDIGLTFAESALQGFVYG
jgi:hypothetical protein